MTMAATHQSVAITNSCFKQPVNPNTGFPSTRSEREHSCHVNESVENEVSGDNRLTTSVNFDTTNTFDGTFQQDLGELSDDAFYHKLVTLRQEHKKTLELCEQLYTDKIEDTRNTKAFASAVSVSKDFSMSPQVSLYDPRGQYNKDEFESLRKRNFLSPGQDRIKDLSMSKPPSGRPKAADAAMRSSFSNSREGLNDSAISGRSTISGMWENFSVDEYVPPVSTRPRSASLSRMSSTRSKRDKDAENEKKKTTKDWKHKITVPEPFNMTLRDSSKPPTVSRVWHEVEAERDEKAKAEEAELQKKFKAQPVPAHVYMPLFDEIMEKQETQRRSNKERNKQLLKSQEKPFKFMKREDEKKHQRQTRPKSAGYLRQADSQTPKQFKAKPFPAKLFEGSVIDRQKEEDEYRAIRVQMRSKELLETAALPPNMASRGNDYVDGKSRQKMYAERAKQAGLSSEHKFVPKTNREMPNFDEVHRQYMREIAARKAQREATVCKPFNLRASTVNSKYKVYEDIERDEQTLKENRWPYKNPRAKPLRMSPGMSKTLSTSRDAIPAQMTAAAQLRASANQAKLEQKIQGELDELEASRKKRIREQTLNQSIKQKCAANDLSLSLERQRRQKLKDYRESEMARQEEYQGHLAEMKERVDKRPLLFERTAEENARRAATKKYQATLAAAGVQEEFVERKGASTSSSFRSGNVTEDDDVYSPRHSSYRSSPRSPVMAKKFSDTFERHSSPANGAASE